MKKLDYYEICFSKMKYLNYSENTIKCYLYYIEQFLKNFNNLSRLNSLDFQNYINNYNFKSISQQNQIINSLRFLYKYGLEKKYDKVNFERPRRENKLPIVIDKDFLLDKISKIKNKKHKAIISLAYSVGLRVSEVINLKITDIDSKRMVINIKQTKGNKDRIVPLSNNILLILREYFKEYHPIEYLFNGINNQQYSATSCNSIVKKYLNEKCHFHLLRHSAFTNLVDSGVDISIIQKLAGHSNIKTTSLYLHLSTAKLQNLPLAI